MRQDVVTALCVRLRHATRQQRLQCEYSITPMTDYGPGLNLARVVQVLKNALNELSACL